MVNIEEIKKQIQGEVLSDPETLEKYSRDASIFEVRPQAVVCPKNVEDVKNVVRWVVSKKNPHPSPLPSAFAEASADREGEGENQLSITARCAGTDMSGAAVGEGIILDFTAHFNRIFEIQNSPRPPLILKGEELHQEIQSHNGYGVVGPGVFYRDFEAETLKKNLILPCYTASKSLNTVGGMVGNNSAGEKTLSMGQTKDYVEELNIVLSDGNEYIIKPLSEQELEQKLKQTDFEGNLYRSMYRLIKDNYEIIQKARPTTSKNAAGYYLWNVWDKKKFDLTQLITGSQGTLGLITKIKLKLIHPNPKSRLLVVFLKDLSRLGDLVYTLLKYHPESLESFDDHTFSLAVKFLPDMIKKMSRKAGFAFGGIGNLLKLFWQFLPEVFMAITGGLPKLILICEFTGEDMNIVSGIAQQAQSAIKRQFGCKTHITKSETETQKYWTVRRESFSLLRQHSKGLQTAPFVDDIVVHPKELPEFLPRLNEIFSRYPSLIYTIAGHAGDANFHIIPLMNLADVSQREIIPKLSDEVYNLVLEYKGSITAEHNDGLIRTPYLEKMFGAKMCELFRKTKEIFDPLNIFNPGKKVGGTIEYAMGHIKRS